MNRSRWLLICVLLLLAWQGSHRLAENSSETPAPELAAPIADNDPSAAAQGTLAVGSEAKAAMPGNNGLPPEARATLHLIATGGPFPYERDGSIFGNYEKQLPTQARGYYREYTVPTPGEKNRGARRIVTGGDPPEVFYYTDNHYRSFREMKFPEVQGRP